MMRIFAGLAVLLLSAFTATAQLTFSGSMLGPLRARALGPATMSGRISCLAVVDTAPRRFYVGSAGGGVWRTSNGGVTFTPVFDEHNQSIGAITIDQARPDTVWVGTGESWTRNSVSSGDGIYRTADGGRTWSKLGLDSTERIARIAIHPKKPTTVFVAAPGPLFADSEHRGLYRTTDNGVSWTRVLSGDGRTGCADVVIDPRSPNTIIATMWSFRRTPYSFTSGGSGSGIFRSTDGGTTWTRIRSGLPTGDLGRIALAMSPSDPSYLYASVEADTSGLYHSADGGRTWSRRYIGPAVEFRPFYFSRLVCDPRNRNVIYKCGLTLVKSDNGGDAFVNVATSAHSDHHDVWINPADSRHLRTATDGGLYESFDGGLTVRFFANLPLSQFYHVTTDDAVPFRVYGGLQDNGSWRGPSNAAGGISNGDWEFVGGGDGFHVLVNPAEPEVVYWESQGGSVNRTDRRTNESKSIVPVVDSTSDKLRFNWNTPVVLGRSGRLYVGSQYLHRSTDRGDSWTRLTADLTTNDPAKLRQEESGGITVDNSSAENHCTILSIAESPLRSSIVWVGTDDGNVQRTTDDGQTWTNVTPRTEVVPAGYAITGIEASQHDASVVYVTVDGHMVGDQRPYVLRSSDLGATWQPLSTAGVSGYAHVVREDPVRSDLLYLGTENGLWISLDRGATWAAFRNNLAPVAVRDLAVHRRDHALVIATHGRGIAVIDNLDVLRSIDPASITDDLTILPPRPAIRTLAGGGARWFGGDESFYGETTTSVARVWYVLRDRHMRGPFTITIRDSAGNVIRTQPASTRKGLNSVDLALRMPAPLTGASDVSLTFGAFQGPLLPEGTYTVELSKGGVVRTTPLVVVTDTIYRHTAEDRASQQRLTSLLYRRNEELAVTIAYVRAGRDSLRRLNDPSFVADVEALDSLHRSLVNTRVGSLTGEEQLRERLASLYGEVNGYLGRPSASQTALAERLGAEVDNATRRATDLLQGKPVESRSTVEDRLRKTRR